LLAAVGIFWSGRVDIGFEGVFGVGEGTSASLTGESSGSGVVVHVELKRSELMLPHVFEKAETDDAEGPNGRGPGVNCFDPDRDFNREEGVLVERV
jgi:hypothetical protein